MKINPFSVCPPPPEIFMFCRHCHHHHHHHHHHDGYIIFFVGGPGAGKGTICARISKKYNYCHLSAGDLLREEVSKGSERGQMIQEIIKEGALVPQDITISLLRDAMREHKDVTGFLIDGFPREISQGEQFEQEVRIAEF